MVNSRLRPLLAVAAFCVAAPALAHHSATMFDMVAEMTLVGTVKQFQYTNPHSWIQVMVPGEGGAPQVEWSIETQAPIVLLRAGIKPTSLQPGDKVIVRFHPLKDGTPGGEMIDVKKEDGTLISLRGVVPPGGQAPY
jgi:hypothetical protein